MLEEDPEIYGAHGPLDRVGRLDHLAALRARRRATSARPATRGSTRTRATRRATTWRRSTRTSPASWRTKLEHPLSLLGERAGVADARGRRLDGAARGHRRRRRQRRRPRHRARRQGDRARPDARRHGHLDLPRDERRPPRRGARACAASCTTGSCRGCTATRPGQSGVGDIFGWFVEQRRARRPTTRRRASSGVGLHEHLTELARAPAHRRARAGRARLAQRQPLGARRPRAERHDRRPHARHAAPRTSTARCWRRRPSARARSSRRSRRPGCRSRSSSIAGGLLQEPVPDADVRRRDAARARA